MGGSGSTGQGDGPVDAQADAYPAGDMVGEGFWRLAWSAYQAGETDDAINWAIRMAAEVPIHTDPVHVIGAKYWAARWHIYPDVRNPDALSPSQEDIGQGIEALAALLSEHPTSFYAIHASNRLRELRQRPGIHSTPLPSLPRHGRCERRDRPPAARRTTCLPQARVIKQWPVTPSEKALIASIANRADPVRAFDSLQHFLMKYPPSTLGPDRDRILEVAYPDRYWSLIQEVSAAYDYDPRIFHALVREESGFNKDIRSWAGAKGLSQLMPATAKQVAGWLGRSVSSATTGTPSSPTKPVPALLFDHFDNNAFRGAGTTRARATSGSG